MKRNILIFLITITSYSFAQTFSNNTGQAYNSWNSSNTWVSSFSRTINVTGVSNPLSNTTSVLKQINLRLGDGTSVNLTTYSMRLTSPSGTVLIFCSPADFNATAARNVDIKYRDDALLTTPASSNEDPYDIGYYRVSTSNSFSNFNGENPNGNWTFEMIENTSFEIAFVGIDLVFGSPISVNDVSGLSANDNCSTPQCLSETSVVKATINGFTGNNTTDPNVNAPWPGGCQWNAARNNSAWFYFNPSLTTAKITISGISAAIQTLVIEEASSCISGSQAVPSGGCPRDLVNDTYTSPRYTTTAGSTANQQFNLSGLTPGTNYILVVDGNGGAISPLYIEMSGGINDVCCPTVINGLTSICSGSSSTLYTQTGGLIGGTWSVSPIGAGSIDASGNFTPVTTSANDIPATISYNDGNCIKTYNITVVATPTADAPINVIACDSYVLPALTVGNYYTGSAGTGTALIAGASITGTQTIYVYAQTGTTPNCTDENNFVVTINTTPTADAPINVTACDSYVLPALTVGNYYTGSAGTGTALTAGASITGTQTIYVYAQTGTTPNCTDENSFVVTINTTPTADAPINVTACDSYVLPSLTVGSYYTGSAGTGTALTAGASITSTQTIYVYAQTGTTPNCTDENSFVVTINTTPTADAPINVTACDSYVLPALTVGNYYSGSAGTGTALTAGASITSTQTIYVYAQTGTTPNCSDENSFGVTINTTPNSPSGLNDLVYCSIDVLSPIVIVSNGDIVTWYGDISQTNIINVGNTLVPLLNTQNYFVTFSENGCESNATQFTITINDCDINIPTAFTPDKDNVNDVWELENIDQVYPENVVRIYNRWGNLLFESEKGKYENKPWDGKYNGEQLPVASYYFMIEYNTNKKADTGTVSIILK